jgi:hypothetical protein
VAKKRKIGLDKDSDKASLGLTDHRINALTRHVLAGESRPEGDEETQDWIIEGLRGDQEKTREYKPVSDFVTTMADYLQCTSVNAHETEHCRKMVCEFVMKAARDHEAGLV